MKHKLLKSLLLLSALVGGMSTAWATDPVTIWSENWTGTTSGTAASTQYDMISACSTDANITYSTSGTVKLYYENTGGGTAPELYIKNGGSWTVSISDLKGCSGALTLTYYTNKSTTIPAVTANSPVTVGAASSTGTAKQYQRTITLNGATSLELVFSVTANTRLDNIVLTGTQPSVATPTFSPLGGVYTSAQNVTLSCETDGATIYYTKGDNPADPTDASTEYTGAITVDATTTIKAIAIKNSDESEIVSARYAIVDHAGTAADPYDVADAIDYISTLGDATSASDVYVRGIISQIDGYNDQYNTITYWISDDGTTTKQMEVFGGKGLDGANFSAVTDLTVGQTVTVKGKVKKYGEISEFDSNSQIFLQESDLTKTGDINLSMASPSTTATASNFFTSSSTGAYTYEIGNNAVASVTNAGVVTPVVAGTTTLTVTQAADVNYKGKSITINVIVAAASLNSTTIVVDPNGSTPYGTPKVVDYQIDDTYDGTVAAVSDCEAVATVVITQPTSGAGTFTITPKAVGTAIITISAPATATCEAADDEEYIIYVVGPEELTTAAPALEMVFAESFEDCKSDGGNDDNFATASTTEIASNKVDDYTDNDGWSFTKGYPAHGCVKFGGSSSKGSATTPAITVVSGKTYSLLFKAAPWSTEASKTMTVKVTGGTIDGKTSVTTSAMTAGQWNDFIFDVVATSNSMTLDFSCSANRFFLDNVFVASGLITAKLNSYGFGTFCSEYPLDFSKANAEDQGFTAWNITAVDENSGVITFAQIDEPVAGGAGVFLKGEPNATVLLTSADSNTIPVGLLCGTLAPTYIAQGQTAYGLKGNKFVPIAAESVLPANKAALVLPPSGGMVIINPVKEFTFDFSETPDGIVSPLGETEEGAGAIYNLAGQRLQKMQKGINIVNGKKILK